TTAARLAARASLTCSCWSTRSKSRAAGCSSISRFIAFVLLASTIHLTIRRRAGFRQFPDGEEVVEAGVAGAALELGAVAALDGPQGRPGLQEELKVHRPALPLRGLPAEVGRLPGGLQGGAPVVSEERVGETLLDEPPPAGGQLPRRPQAFGLVPGNEEILDG